MLHRHQDSKLGMSPRQSVTYVQKWVRRSLGKIFLLVMTILFAYRLYLVVERYLREEVVQEVSLERRLLGVTPPLTVCLLPGYNKSSISITDIPDFDTFCTTPEEREDPKACVDAMRLGHKDLVDLAFSFPDFDFGRNVKENFHETSFNLILGSCFTYQRRVLRPVSPITSDVILSRYDENSLLTQGWTLYAFVHDENQFVPSLGLSPEFNGQHMRFVTPALFKSSLLQATRLRKIRLNTAHHKCVEDPGYRIAQCAEEFSTQFAGCSSPWNLYPSQVPNCKTYDEFTKLARAHLAIFNLGATQFQNFTGCLPPCEYDDFVIQPRGIIFPQIMNTFGMNISAVAITQTSTNIKVFRDVLLYDFESLLGEVGGNLGIFLGYSFITFYHATLWALNKSLKLK